MDDKLTLTNSKPQIRYLVGALIWMVLIFIVSGIPSEHIPKAGIWDLLVKKGGHMAAYAILAVLWCNALGAKKFSWWAGFAIAVLYSVSDEYHQTFVPGRNGHFQDVLVDAAGALVGLIVWRVISKKNSSIT